MTKGFVWIVGAGPGHPDYLTLRGLKILEQADVILFDALLAEDFQKLFPEDAIKIFVGKRRGIHSITQEKINELLIKHASEGKKVVRLKGGDGFVFGRGGEEVLALKQANILFEMIPGVSNVNGASGLFGIPLTHRQVSSQFWVVECSQEKRDDLIDWEGLVKFKGTVVILMGGHRLLTISKKLLEAGAEPILPVALIEGASFADGLCQKTILAKVGSGEVTPKTSHPCIVYLGPTVEVLS